MTLENENLKNCKMTPSPSNELMVIICYQNMRVSTRFPAGKKKEKKSQEISFNATIFLDATNNIYSNHSNYNYVMSLV